MVGIDVFPDPCGAGEKICVFPLRLALGLRFRVPRRAGLLFPLLYGFFELAEAAEYYVAGGGDVEAHVARPLVTEHSAVVEGEVGIVYEKAHQLVVRQSKGAAVEPYEEGCLGPARDPET